jgi:hypothetical protein
MADTLGKKDLDDAPVSQVEETNVEVVKHASDGESAEKAQAEHINLNKNLSAKYVFCEQSGPFLTPPLTLLGSRTPWQT